MAREKETFRLELEQLYAEFPQKRILTRTDLMHYTGRGRKWLDSHGFKGTGFTIVEAANNLAALREGGARR